MKISMKLWALALLFALPSVAFGFDQDNFRYTTVTGGVSLTVINKSALPAEVVIPSQVTDNGTPYDVVEIASFAFQDAQITRVTIPNTVKVINAYAFRYARQLEEVSFEAGCTLTTIGSNAFVECTSLLEFVMPTSVTTINPSAFQGCTGLKTVVLRGAWTTANDRIFANCTSLSNVTFGSEMSFIPNFMFDGCKALTSITIPSNITEIRSSAFANTGLTTLTIPSTVKKIGDYLCDNCTDLHTVSLNGAWTSTGNYIFNNCTSLSTVNIGSDVTYIPNRMFVKCTALTSLTLPANVTEIQIGAFYSSGLQSFTIPSTVTTLGTYIFENCRSLTSVSLPTNMTTIPEGMFKDCKGMTSFTIPSHITALGINAFQGSGLTSVTIPANITSIQQGVFADCLSLETVTIDATCAIGNQCFTRDVNLKNVIIGPNVTSVVESAFNGCTSLQTVTFDSNSIATTIGANAFLNCSSLTSVTIPASVTTIDGSAFKGCSNLTTVNLSEGLITLGNDVFSGCTKLNNVVLPNSLTSVGNSLFYNCKALSNITIGSGLTKLNDNMFQYCTSLTSINVPETITQYGNTVFSDCTSLESFTMSDNVTSMGNYVFSGCTSLQSVYLTNKLTTIPAYTFRGCTSLTSFTIPANITRFDDGAFAQSGLTSITVPGTVKTIGGSAFERCASLTSATLCPGIETLVKNAFIESAITSIEVPSTVTGIGQGVFARCNSLISATIHSSGSIGDMCFENSKNLQTVVIDGNITTFGTKVFNGCEKLSSVTLPETLTTWGTQTFSSCKALASVTIPESLTTIPASTFYDCSALETLVIPTSVTSIGKEAFRNCTALDHIVIPNSVTLIDDNAFRNCTSLADLTLSNRLETINPGAFAYCSSLESIVIPNSVTTMGTSVFEYDTKLKSAVLPNRRITLYAYTFQNCTSLETVELPGTLQTLGTNCFYNCSSLRTIKCEAATPPALESNVFYNVDGRKVTVQVPQMCVSNYTGNANWNGFNIEGVTAYKIDCSVSDSDAGSVAIVPNQNIFFPNKPAQLVATNNRNYTFTNWTEGADVIGTGTEYDFIVTEDRNIIANFRTYDRMEIPATPEHPFYFKWGSWSESHAAWQAENNCYAWIHNNNVLSYDVTVVEQVPMLIKVAAGTINNGAKFTVKFIQDGTVIFQQTVNVANNDSWSMPFPIYEVEAPALPVGDYTLTFTFNGHATAVMNVGYIDVVADPGGITGISLDCEEKELFIGESFQLTATIEPEDAVNKAVTWSTSNPTLATVSNEGLVTAIGVGQVIITATSANGMTAVCAVDIIPDAVTYGTGANALQFHDSPNKDTRPDNFVAKDAGDNWVANRIVLTDAQPFECPENVNAAVLNYTRTFGNTYWQPLYVPFNMHYSEWADKADVAMINDVHQFDNNNDGIYEKTTLEFKRLQPGSELLPNVPYVIKAKEAGEVTFECTNKVLTAHPSYNGKVDCSSTTILYTLEGIYQSKEDMEGVYAMREGAFVQASSSSYPLSPMRIFLTIEPRNGGYGVPSANYAPALVRIMVDGVEEDISGLMDIIIENANDGIYYDMMGRQVKNPSPGIYIQNGVKVIIK